MSVNKVTNYSGKTFLGNSSAKPIVGLSLRGIYTYDLSQGKLKEGGVLPGQPIKAENNVSNSTGAGMKLNPNVLSVSKASTAEDVCGFLLINETDVLGLDEEAPVAQVDQVVNVALLGSRVEMYLPADSTLQGIATNKKVAWDFDTNSLKISASGTIDVLGPVVDGVKFALSGSNVTYEDCKCIKVRL